MQNKMWNCSECDLHALTLKKVWGKAFYFEEARGLERRWRRREDSDFCICKLSVFACAREVELGCVLPNAHQSYRDLQCLVKRGSVMWYGSARNFRGKHNKF